MPIEQLEAGAVFTGAGIKYYSLCALRQRVKLEGLGMKGRGKSALKHAKDTFGIKGTREQIIAYIEAKMDEQKILVLLEYQNKLDQEEK